MVRADLRKLNYGGTLAAMTAVAACALAPAANAATQPGTDVPPVYGGT